MQTGSAPGEITGIAWNVAKDTLSWSSDVLATKYDVSRGVLSDLRDMENFRWAACLASKTTATSVGDTEVPAAGSGFYYLVRGRARTCLLGTWGSALRNDTIRECP